MKRILGVLILFGTIMFLFQEQTGAEPNFQALSEMLTNSGIRPVTQPISFPSQTGNTREEICLPYTPTPFLTPRNMYILGESETLSLAEDIGKDFSVLQKLITMKVQSIGTTRTLLWWQVSPHSTIAIMSEQMDEQERLGFVDHWGYEPTKLRIAADPVVLIVHPSNPLVQRGITPSELDGIFSQTPSQETAPIQTWNDLDLNGPEPSGHIMLHGYDTSVSLYDYFKNQALQGKEFHNRVHRHPGSGQVVFAVGEEKGALGYTKLSSVTAQVEIVPLRENSQPLAHKKNHTLNPAYPFAHYVYGYLNLNPETHSDEAAVEIFKFLYSQQGQLLLKKRGYLPLPGTMISQEWQQLRKGSDRNIQDSPKICSLTFQTGGFS
ncbi:MAG: hypothetical protein NPIRA03_06620 [Nitrospirales bacterium]|nr:MAG: hypothetical protein NPIRA03_06620 [Nitrospirales bacterium]